MIERLNGRYIISTPTGIILDINGVGYGVEMPLTDLCRLPVKDSNLEVWVHTYVKEDALKLFGFLRREDRLVFEILIGLNGVGPKMALAVLSTLSIDAIRQAVILDDPSVFETVPGIGKRLAERIKVDLKSKIKKLQQVKDGVSGKVSEETLQMAYIQDKSGAPVGNEAVFEDLRSALENLGFKEKVVDPLIAKLRSSNSSSGFQDLMKRALKEIGGQGATRSNRSVRKADQPSL